MVSSGLWWSAFVGTCLSSSESVWAGLCLTEPVYVSLHWFMSIQSVPAYVGPYQSMSAHASVCQSVPVYTSLRWSVPIYVSLY